MRKGAPVPPTGRPSWSSYNLMLTAQIKTGKCVHTAPCRCLVVDIFPIKGTVINNLYKWPEPLRVESCNTTYRVHIVTYFNVVYTTRIIEKRY